jgi:acetyl esterase
MTSGSWTKEEESNWGDHSNGHDQPSSSADLLPALAPAFEGLHKMANLPPGLSIAEMRAWLHQQIDEVFTAMYENRPPVESEVDHRIAVKSGEIAARVYSPKVSGLLPCYLYLHGGGFWLGTLDQGNSTCRGIATDAACVVVNLDYRLAPEHKFPTAAEDCYTALAWIIEHANELNVDPDRIAVGGGSAGGNLAAAVSLMSCHRGGPKLALQVLEIAALDLTDKADAETLYLRNQNDARNPYASPLLAPDLGGLPPALVMSAELDPLRSEDAAYAQRLREAGVPVEERCWKGQFHGSMQLAKLIPFEAAEYHAHVVKALRRAFRTGPTHRRDPSPVAEAPSPIP